MPNQLITAPTAEPFVVSDAQRHRRAFISADESTLERQIKSARIRAENFTDRKLMTQTWDYLIDWCFPGVIELPFLPVQSVTSINYIGTDGVSTLLTSTEYVADVNSVPARIYEAYDSTWPTTRGIQNAVTIRFIAGYTSADEVPEDIKSAMYLMIGDEFELREDSISGTIITKIPEHAHNLLWPYRWQP